MDTGRGLTLWQRALRRRGAWTAAGALLLVWAGLVAAVYAPTGQEGGLSLSPETLTTFVVALVTGALGMPLIDWLKHRLGLSQTGALVFAYVASIVLAAAALLLTGAIGAVDLTGDHFFVAMGTVISTANFVYRLFNKTPQS